MFGEFIEKILEDDYILNLQTSRIGSDRLQHVRQMSA